MTCSAYSQFSPLAPSYPSKSSCTSTSSSQSSTQYSSSWSRSTKVTLSFWYFLVLGGLLYPPNIWEVEFATIIFFFFIQVSRLYFGYHANRTEHTFSMTLFLFATLLSTLFFIYFSFLTTYVLLIEMIVGIIGIFFGVTEILLSAVATIKFQKVNAVWVIIIILIRINVLNAHNHRGDLEAYSCVML